MRKWLRRLDFKLYLKFGRWVIVVFREPTAAARKR